MKKIIDYFYIFSKLTTSLVLVFIIFIMSYGLYRSYKGIDSEVASLEINYKSLTNEIIQNNNNFNNLDKQIDKIQLKITQINESLKNYSATISEEQYNNDINHLLDLHDELIIKFDNIVKKKSLNNKNHEDDSTLNNQIISAVNLVLIKYKNGENINKEFSYLEKIIPIEKINILEKINVIKSRPFYGFINLKIEFDLATKEYINAQFLNSNKNSVLKFIFNFITISPSGLNIYEKEEMNLLMSAKKDLEKENLNASLKSILKLDEDKRFFIKWIKQVNLYLDFVNEIQKVI